MTAALSIAVAVTLPLRTLILRWRGARIRVPPMSAQWLKTHENSSAKRGSDH
jgi:hypothetical protein